MNKALRLSAALILLSAVPRAQDLLVTSWNNDAVLRYDGQTGAFQSTFVTSGSGALNQPHSATFGPDGNLYVTSFANDRVLRYDGSTGAFIDAFVTPGLGGLDGPTSAEFGRDGDLYVSSYNTPGVLRYHGRTGALIGTFISPGNGLNAAESGQFGRFGDYYLANGGGTNVLRYDGQTGAFLGVFASGNGLNDPHTAVFGPNGNLFATSFSNRRVNEYDGVTGAFLRIFVPAGNGLNGAHGLYFDDQGFLLVAAFNSDRVVRYDATTGAFVDAFVAPAAGGLDGPISITPIPEPAAVTSYGSGINPAGSLTVTGSPSIGGTVTFTLANPLGTQSAATIGILGLSLAPDPAFPAGLLLSGFGLAGGGAPGELLIRLDFLFVTSSGGPLPVAFAEPVPANVGLVGVHSYAQGFLVDPTPPAGAPAVGFTEAHDLLIGF